MFNSNIVDEEGGDAGLVAVEAVFVVEERDKEEEFIIGRYLLRIITKEFCFLLRKDPILISRFQGGFIFNFR